MALTPPPQQDKSTDGLNWRNWFSKAYSQITTTIPALITAGDDLRVLKAGDTMTGTLTMDTANIIGDGTTIWIEGYAWTSGPDSLPGPYVDPGEGTRLLFIQDTGKYGAFRSGYVSGNQWDVSNIGAGSVAFGEDTKAPGWGDFACGAYSTINTTSDFNFVAGFSNSISGSQTKNAVFGGNNTVSGSGGGNFLAGLSNTASSLYGVALGQQNAVSNGSGAVALGVLNTSSGGGAIAIGTSCSTTASQGVAIGASNTCSAGNAVAIGKTLTIDTAYSTAIGRSLSSNGFSAVTMLGSAGASVFAATANNTFYVLGGTTTPLIDLNSTAGTIRTNVLTTTGGRIKKTRRVTAAGNIFTTDDVVFCNTGTAYTVTLPNGVEGQTFRIINSGTSANNLTVQPATNEYLIGIINNSVVLTDGQSLEITYNATDGWY